MNAGGVAAVVDYVGESRSNVRLPGIMMLGYVAAHSENLAMAVIVSKVRLVMKSFFSCIPITSGFQLYKECLKSCSFTFSTLLHEGKSEKIISYIPLNIGL